MKISCMYCTNDHKFVCDCGHKHDHHVFGGGCKHSNCECPCYIQKHQRLAEETEKEFRERILHPDTLRKKKRQGVPA